MNYLNMEDEKLHFHDIMIYEFRKWLSVGTVRKNFQNVICMVPPSLQAAKISFGKFH